LPVRGKSGAALTPLELEIMNVLWETGSGNVQAVQEKLQGRELAYTTVQTMLNVLHRKGKVTRKLRDRAYIYRPVLSRQNAVTQALGDMLDRFFGGSADSLVLSLVEAKHLTPEKLARIQKSLEDKGPEAKRKEMKNGNV
jgi:BlaI family transcriptional regulator, penicillinase repressor